MTTNSISHNYMQRGARCLKFKASKLWNELHDRLKSITNFATFKKQLKALLTNDEGTELFLYFNL